LSNDGVAASGSGALGYTQEKLKGVVSPLAAGAEAVWSMGDDSALAVLRAAHAGNRVSAPALRASDQPADRALRGLRVHMRAWSASGETNGDVPRPQHRHRRHRAARRGRVDALAYDAGCPARIALDLRRRRSGARIAAIGRRGERCVREGATYLVL